MNWYPWLTADYKSIINLFQINKGHHTFLIQSSHGMGSHTLILAIAQWLLCLNTKNEKSCGQCHGCKLMLSNNHPDWHHIQTPKNKNILGIELIRSVSGIVFNSTQQGKNKIIYFPHAEKFTKLEINALLKTIEEPPKNTFFFIRSNNNHSLQLTLLSRCFKYSLSHISEIKYLKWIKNKSTDEDIYLAAFRLCQKSPISAKSFISSPLWLDRKFLLFNLFKIIHTKNTLQLISIINDNNFNKKIYWICSILLDSINYKFYKSCKLTNIDQRLIVRTLSTKYSYGTLNKSIHTWIKCQYQLINIVGINRELLLIEQLLAWQKILINN